MAPFRILEPAQNTPQHTRSEFSCCKHPCLQTLQVFPLQSEQECPAVGVDDKESRRFLWIVGTSVISTLVIPFGAFLDLLLLIPSFEDEATSDVVVDGCVDDGADGTATSLFV